MRKYLESIEAPNVPPGPFSVRLKYELKKEFFDRRQRSWFPAMSVAAAALMLALLITVVVQPDLADQVHYAIAPQAKDTAIASEKTNDGQFLSDEDYRQTVARLQSMANDGRSPAVQVGDLRDLDPDKSYIIRRTTDGDDRNIYFVSEVKSRPKMY